VGEGVALRIENPKSEAPNPKQNPKQQEESTKREGEVSVSCFPHLNLLLLVSDFVFQISDLQQMDIRRLEELSLNAWPGLRQVVRDGWVLRFGDGYTGRANSVHALYDGSDELREKVSFCEQEYWRRGLPSLFKMTPAARPEGLDGVLESRGYRAFNHTSVQVADLDGQRGGEDADVSASDVPTESWVQSFAQFRSLNDRQVSALRGILANVALPARFVSVRESGETVACGLGVAEPPWVGLFDIGTREESRRRGYATAVIHSILNWARHAGAGRAYLQVMAGNAPAVRLYEKLGFREAYRYWYRSKRAP
jgi:GNAT superfamily N-acetyltransferase